MANPRRERRRDRLLGQRAARYARVERRVLVSPPREVEETLPAETATRLRTVVVEPAQTMAREIPARYATRERAVLASPGGRAGRLSTRATKGMGCTLRFAPSPPSS